MGIELTRQQRLLVGVKLFKAIEHPEHNARNVGDALDEQIRYIEKGVRELKQIREQIRATERAQCDHDWDSWGTWEKICNKCSLVTSN